jgi:glycosyltransferase involved in cell wall biosynthesis
LVVDGESGVLVAPLDIAGWATASKLLLDDEESIRLGHGAHSLWQERYRPERGLEHLEDAYRDALTPREDLEPE